MAGPLIGGGGGKAPEPLRKKSLFSIIKKKWPKPHEPLRSRGGGGYPDLNGPTTKKATFFICMCVFPKGLSWN